MIVRLPVCTVLLAAFAVPAAAQPDERPEDDGEPQEEEETDDEALTGGVAGAPIAEPLPGVLVPPPIADDPNTTIDAPIPTGPQEVGDVEAPPFVWSDFVVEGTLVEPAETVRTILEPTMELRRGAMTRRVRSEIADYLLAFGYHLLSVEPRQGENGTIAVLTVEPVTLVRRIQVDVSGRRRFWQPRRAIFADDVKRRMRLRPGAQLARDPAERQRQLDAERVRITDYLRDEGFFEARVAVRARRDSRWGAKIDVDIDKGPRYRVGTVSVIGAENIPVSEIEDVFEHCVIEIRRCRFPSYFVRSRLTKDVEKVVQMYQKRGFPGVRVRTDFDPRTSFKRNTKTVEFNVYVSERRRIDVVFEGNDPERFPAKQLEKHLTFDQEGSYDEVEMRNSADAIRLYYQTRGFFEANVTFKPETFTDFDFIRVVFTIDAGPKLRVREIRFDGNRSISTKELQSKLSIETYESLPIFGSGGYATSETLRADVRTLEAFYREKGFPEARVRAWVTRDERIEGNAAALAAAVAGGSDAKWLYITFVVEEGPRQLIERLDVTFKGEHEQSEDEVRRVLGLAAGDPFHKPKLNEALRRLRRFYFKQGHPHAILTPAVTPGADGRSKIVAIEVKESHEVTFGKLVIRGNFKTADWIIEDELGYHEGRPLTLTRAERGQQNLRNTGLFNSVQVGLVELDETRKDEVHVVAQVEERYDHRFEGDLSAGYSTDRGLFASAKGIIPNIGGLGLRNELSGTVGQELNEVEDRVVIPRWIARRAVRLAFRTELAAFYRKEQVERFGDLTSFGGSVAVSKVGRHGFFRGWILSLRYDFRQRNREEDLVRPAGASDDLRKERVTTRTGAIGPVLIIDKRRDAEGRVNPLTPEKGYKLEFRAVYADRALLGQDRFVKLGFSAQHFWKITDRLLLSNGLRWDQGIPLGNEVLLPEVERFFAGGDTTVRGFEEDRLATELVEKPVPPFGEVTQLSVLPAGGNARGIHNLDLQVRVWEVKGIPIASSVFFDTGLVTNSLDSFDITDLRHSIGIAFLRIVAPFGSASFEWAMPLDPQPGDNPRGRFHFNFGLLIP